MNEITKLEINGVVYELRATLSETDKAEIVETVLDELPIGDEVDY